MTYFLRVSVRDYITNLRYVLKSKYIIIWYNSNRACKL